MKAFPWVAVPSNRLVRLLKQDAVTTELDVEGLASKVIKTADAGIVYTLDAIATATAEPAQNGGHS